MKKISNELNEIEKILKDIKSYKVIDIINSINNNYFFLDNKNLIIDLFKSFSNDPERLKHIINNIRYEIKKDIVNNKENYNQDTINLMSFILAQVKEEDKPEWLLKYLIKEKKIYPKSMFEEVIKSNDINLIIEYLNNVKNIVDENFEYLLMLPRKKLEKILLSINKDLLNSLFYFCLKNNKKDIVEFLLNKRFDDINKKYIINDLNLLKSAFEIRKDVINYITDTDLIEKIINFQVLPIPYIYKILDRLSQKDLISVLRSIKVDKNKFRKFYYKTNDKILIYEYIMETGDINEDALKFILNLDNDIMFLNIYNKYKNILSNIKEIEEKKEKILKKDDPTEYIENKDIEVKILHDEINEKNIEKIIERNKNNQDVLYLIAKSIIKHNKEKLKPYVNKILEYLENEKFMEIIFSYKLFDDTLKEKIINNFDLNSIQAVLNSDIIDIKDKIDYFNLFTESIIDENNIDSLDIKQSVLILLTNNLIKNNFTNDKLILKMIKMINIPKYKITLYSNFIKKFNQTDEEINNEIVDLIKNFKLDGDSLLIIFSDKYLKDIINKLSEDENIAHYIITKLLGTKKVLSFDIKNFANKIKNDKKFLDLYYELIKNGYFRLNKDWQNYFIERKENIIKNNPELKTIDLNNLVNYFSNGYVLSHHDLIKISLNYFFKDEIVLGDLIIDLLKRYKDFSTVKYLIKKYNINKKSKIANDVLSYFNKYDPDISKKFTSLL